MNTNSLKQFVALRESLQRERVNLAARLADIDRALGISSSAAASLPPAPRRGRPPKVKRVRPPYVENAMPLKDAILKVTKAKPLTKEEILAAVQKIGYRFASSQPLHSLSVRLYADKAIKNFGGKFGPAK